MFILKLVSFSIALKAVIWLLFIALHIHTYGDRSIPIDDEFRLFETHKGANFIKHTNSLIDFPDIGPTVAGLNDNDDMIIGIVIKTDMIEDHYEKIRKTSEFGFFIINKHNKSILSGLTYNEFMQKMHEYKFERFNLEYPNFNNYKGTL